MSPVFATCALDEQHYWTSLAIANAILFSPGWWRPTEIFFCSSADAHINGEDPSDLLLGCQLFILGLCCHMPRQARIVVPGSAHHVTQRGNQRRQLFFSDEDYRLYLMLLGETAPRFGVCLQAIA